MKEKPNTDNDAAALRDRAEVLLKKRRKKTAKPQTKADTQRLLHELQVHQIELEMQNAELQEARDAVEAGLAKVTDLYDFAPVGYFSLDEQGQILEVNLTGAALLGVERSRLAKRRLLRFIALTSRPIFIAFLERVSAEQGKQVCEVELLKEDGTPFWVDLQAEPIASLSGSPKGCRLAVSDITPLKRAAEAQDRMEVLAAANRELTKEIKRRKTVEKALKKSEQKSSRLLTQALQLQKQLRHLSHQVLQVQEEERKRISRELHDEILQTLTGVTVHLATLKKETAANCKSCKRKIAATQRLVENSVEIVHRFARELRPMLLDDLGLIPALHSYMKDVMKRTGLRIHFTSFTRDKVKELDNDRRTVLYRVAQEAITNVVRHAQASRIEVRLEKLPSVIGLDIKDNGKSFRAKRMLSAAKYKRLGLLCMRERVEMVGGTFAIESEPGQGTTVQVAIPFTHEMGEIDSMKQITVLLAEDHTIVREGLRTLLETEADIEVIGEADNGRQAVQLAKKLRPAIVVMDIAMPLLNGLEATRQIVKTVPATKVLILSAHADDEYIEQVARAGAVGYLIKQTSAHVLSQAIREVQQGKTFLSPSIADRVNHLALESPDKRGSLKKKIALTSRELEVLQLVAEGKANKQVATELGISIKTVEKHRQHLMKKLGLHDIAGLTRYAIATGIIESSAQVTIL